MLRHGDRNDLSIFVHGNRNLERRNAGYVILDSSSLRNSLFDNGFSRRLSNRFSRRLNGRFGSRLSCRFGNNGNAIRRRSLLQRRVDGVAGQRYAALDINLRRSQILANQRGKRFIGQHVRTKARGLIVVRGANRSNLAAVLNLNIQRELVHALHGIRIARNRRDRFSVSAKVSRSLLERIVHRVAGQRHAALHVDLRRCDILTHQRVKDALIREEIRAKTRRLVVLRHRDGNDLTRVVQLNRNLKRAEAGHVIGLCAAFGFAGRSSLLERVVNRVAGQRHAALHVDLRRCNILTHQRVKDALIREEIRAEARGLIVFRHNDGNDLAVAVQRNFHVERRKARYLIRARGGFNRRILAVVAAIDCGGLSQNRILIARMRLDAERALRVSQHLLHGVHKRGGRNGRARDGIHIVAQRVRVSRNRDELLLESVVAHAAAEALRLLEGADINLRHIALFAHAEGDRDFSAVTLRIRGQRIALDAAVSVFADENLIERTVVRNTFILNLLVFAVRQHRVQRSHLGGQLLLLDRFLGHFVRDGQQHRGNKRKDEQTERKLHNITHYFLTSPKLLLPVTRSISGEQTFISRMA